MTLAEFFKSLSYGELRQLAMSNDGDGTIRQKDQGTVLHYTNEALMILKTRFDVGMKDVLIELRKHITFYHLRKQFAESQVDTSLSFFKIDSLSYWLITLIEFFTSSAIFLASVMSSFTTVTCPIFLNGRVSFFP